MWISHETVRLGKADVEFREMIYEWGEATALPDRALSAESLIDTEIPRWVLDSAWAWAVRTNRHMSPVVAVSAPQR